MDDYLAMKTGNQRYLSYITIRLSCLLLKESWAKETAYNQRNQ
ncbi:MAG: hypothetical protein ACM3YE_00535 [Bacteroidota bacterium]